MKCVCLALYHLCGLVEILKMSNLVTNFSFVVKVKNDGKNFILRLKFKCTPGTLAKADGKPVILVCQNGTNSSRMASDLKKEEISVFVLKGGINNWVSEKLPLIN